MYDTYNYILLYLEGVINQLITGGAHPVYYLYLESQVPIVFAGNFGH